MEIKLYKILKIYPSLSDEFQVGDYIYLQEEMQGSDTLTYRSGEGFQFHNAARGYYYKKLLHQPKSASIPAGEVENSPEYFEEIKDWQIFPKFNTIMIDDPESLIIKNNVTIDITSKDISVKNNKLTITIPTYQPFKKLREGWEKLLK